MSTSDGQPGGDSTRVVGRGVPRVDAMERVTGKAVYGADVTRAGTLYGRSLRSPYAHARVRRIDVSRAAALPGVKAIVTAADLPAPSGAGASELLMFMDLNDLREMTLAQEKVVWEGHPVAAVAATSPHIADEALRLIRVDYEPLPVVEDVRQAIRPDAPIIHERLRTKGPEGTGDKPTNVSLITMVERGDVERGFREADITLEREFSTEMVHQGYIEPRACSAEVDPSGHVTVWTTAQGSFFIRTQLSVLLGIPQSQITVVPTEVGGAFGGKETIYAVEAPAVLLARKAGRPVKMVMSRDETFKGTGPASPSFTRTKLGVTRDGRITAVKSEVLMDAGAFPGAFTAGVTFTGYSYYHLPNFRVDVYDVVTNKPHVNPYRAPGAPQSHLPLETMLDEVAEQLRMDPVDIRLKNLNPEGAPMSNGVPLPKIGLQKILERIKTHPAWTSPVPAGRGRGLAVGFWGGGSGASTAQITVNGDGTFSLSTGSIDITGVRTSLTQIAAEELGVDVADITIAVGNTDTVPFADGSWGSRTTYATGTATQLAARDCLRQLKERAALALQARVEEIAYKDREFYVRDNPEQKITLVALARANPRQASGPIVGKGTTSALPQAPSTAAHIAEVEVDRDTGRVRVTRYTAFQDPGRAINPMAVEGQIQGGVGQGIGWALWEHYDYVQGAMRNASLLDYRIPTAPDMPMVDVELVSTPAPDGPFGLRGVGEACLIAPISTVANAIARATGVRLRDIPMTPEKVLQALGQKAGAGGR